MLSLLSLFRSGQGSEEIGNVVGVEFMCPLGNKHSGYAFCRYTGEYRQGLFHGYGEFTCSAGPWYKGRWYLGKKHGQVIIV
jgi:hypothetical protein